ncbi:MAG: hypothetical protein GY821_02795, partial [Gammaproteobacteria bacterium]|nr:hypothetical protein [Gammaproteobacteria bacterium]
MAGRKKTAASKAPATALESMQAIQDEIEKQEKAHMTVLDQAMNRLDKDLARVQIKVNASRDKITAA